MLPRTYTLADLQAIAADFLAQTQAIAERLDAARAQVAVRVALTHFLQFVEDYAGEVGAAAVSRQRRYL